jgi:hypothetical protein
MPNHLRNRPPDHPSAQAAVAAAGGERPLRSVARREYAPVRGDVVGT